MKRTTGARLGVVFFLAAAPAGAHHSFAMFDQNKLWKWEGVVVQYNWENPHIHIIVDVPPDTKDENTVGRWDFEGESVAQTARQGWNRKTFSAGDKIIIVGHPMKDGSKGAQGEYTYAPDGTLLYFANTRSITPDSPLKP